MDAKKAVCFMVAAWFVQVGVARGATTNACAVDVADAGSGVTRTDSRTAIDPRSGATLIINRDANGRLTVELKDRRASVRREFGGSASITTLAAGGQKVRITVDGT